EFKTWCEKHNIKAVTTSHANPRANALVERDFAKLCGVIRSYCDENTIDWDDYVPIAEKACNHMQHAITGYTPFFLMHGYHMTWPDERKLEYKQLVLSGANPDEARL